MTFGIPVILTFFMVSLRLGVLFMLIPAFGGTFFPAQMRVILILLISALIAPSVAPIGYADISIWTIAFYGIGEVLIGLYLGISIRAFFAIIEVAGQLISRNIGLMMAQQFDPASGGNSNIVGVLLFYFATILFFMIGGHHQVILSLAKSFEIIGIAKESIVVGNLQSISLILSQVFALGVSISAPFIAVNFIITLGFGVLGKVAPKINVMLMSFSFRIVGGLAIFMITANLIFNFLLHYAEEIPISMLEFLKG